jgi:hypothetical protein
MTHKPFPVGWVGDSRGYDQQRSDPPTPVEGVIVSRVPDASPDTKLAEGIARVERIRDDVQARLNNTPEDSPLMRLALTSQVQVLDAVWINLSQLASEG